MGLRDWVADKFYRAKDWIEDRVDDVKEFLGLSSRGSYTGSIPEAVDVDKVLNNFKELLSKLAAEWEKQSIKDIADKFEQFVQVNTAKFPELAGEVNRRKEEISKKMKDTVMDHINKRLSANDPDFRKALEMQPGKEKESRLKTYQENFIQEAEEKFWNKLQLEMNRLYDDVSKNIGKYLEEKTSKLERQERQYAQLRRQVENGQLNLKELEDACIPAEDAERCMNEIFRLEVMV